MFFRRTRIFNHTKNWRGRLYFFGIWSFGTMYVPNPKLGLKFVPRDPNLGFGILGTLQYSRLVHKSRTLLIELRPPGRSSIKRSRLVYSREYFTSEVLNRGCVECTHSTQTVHSLLQFFVLCICTLQLYFYAIKMCIPICIPSLSTYPMTIPLRKSLVNINPVIRTSLKETELSP